MVGTIPANCAVCSNVWFMLYPSFKFGALLLQVLRDQIDNMHKRSVRSLPRGKSASVIGEPLHDVVVLTQCMPEQVAAGPM